MPFLDETVLWHLLWIIPVILILMTHAATKRKRVLALLFGDRGDDHYYVRRSKGARVLRNILFISAVALLAVAAARPFWGQKILAWVGKGRDVMIVLDVSKSMMAQDVKPSRLEHAKWFVRQLVGSNPGDRFGLIAFAGSSFLECPLTSDQTSFFNILDDMTPDSIPLGGTNIQKALRTALEGFKAAKSAHRAIVLVTDGDELQGDSAKAIGKLNALNIPLFVVGIGDPRKPGVIPVPDESGNGIRIKRDAAGNVVQSKLNEGQLKRLAGKTAGAYARSTATNPELTLISDKISGLVPKEFESGKRTRPIERFQYPLVAALILLFAWFLISERSATKKNVMTLVLAMAVWWGAVPLRAERVDSRVSPQEENRETMTIPATAPSLESEGGKTETVEVAPEEDPVTVYNQALELQKNKDAAATSLYEQAINMSKNNPAVRANSFQNLGVLTHEEARKILRGTPAVARQDLDKALDKIKSTMGELEKAEEMYREAMNAQTQNAQNEREAPDFSQVEVALNQQKLLNDRRLAEKMRKMIEELKKKQQEAQKKTQQAKDQQQKQNQRQQKQQQQQQKQKDQQQQQQQKDQQQKQQKQQQQKQKDQQQRQQQKDQQQQQKQNQRQQKQKNAEQKTKSAKESVERLKNQAQELKNKKIEESAKRAEKEIEKAMEAQRQNQGEKAEEHLKKALKQLGEPRRQKKRDENDKQKNRDENDKGDKERRKDQEKNKGKQDKDDKDKPLPQVRPAEKSDEKKPPEKDIDPAQAEALLDLMANDEKTLKEALKEMQKRRHRVKKIDKDW